MADQSERGVVFTLKVKSDQSVGAVFNDLEKRVSDLQKRLELKVNASNYAGNGNGSPAQGGRAPYRNGVGQPYRPGGWSDLSAMGREAMRQSGDNRYLTGMANPEAQRRRQQDQEQRQRDREQVQRDRERRQRERANAREAADYIKATDKQGAAAEKTRLKEEREASRDIARFQREAVQAERREAREQELALARQREGYARVRESIVSTTEAVTQFGQGLAYVGLIGQRDMGRLADSLLAVQGTLHTLRGGVQSIRDIGGLVRNVRSVGGVGAAGRAFLGLAPAAGHAAGGVAAGGASIVAPIAAAATGVAAALASAGLVIREGMAVGFGRGARVGGVVSNVADMEVGLHSKIGNAALGIIGAGISATAPYGMSARQSELRTEQYLERIGQHAFGWQTVLSNRRTERMTRFAEEDRQRREQMSEGWARGFEQEVGLAGQRQERLSALRGRRRIAAANYQPLTREGELLADPRRLLRDTEQERRELEAMQQRVVTDRMQVMGPTGSIGKGSPYDEATGQQILQLEQRIKQLKAEELQITREMSKTAIDGLKQQEQLQKERSANARGRFEGATDRLQSAQERFGSMTSMERESLLQVHRRLEAGEDVTLHELEVADRGSQRTRFLAAQYRQKRAREDPRFTEMYSVEEQGYGATSKTIGTEMENEGMLHRNIRQAEAAAGIGRGEPIRVDAEYQHKIQVELSGLDDLKKQLTEAIEESVPDILNAFDDSQATLVQEVVRRIQEEVQNGNQMRNMAGKINAGG